MAELPIPSSVEQQHQQQLTNIIVDEMNKQGGAIRFKDYMQLALYQPQFGYYSSALHKFGREGDFITAPEVSSLFGETLANYYVTHIKHNAILEFGAGTGKLASDILKALQQQDNLPEHYYILEVSAGLRKRQQQLLNEKLPDYIDNIIWLDRLPETFSGLIIANEVLDAMPIHKFQVDENNKIQEYYVSFENDHFTWQLKTVDDHALLKKIQQLAIPTEQGAYNSEINMLIKPWLQSIHDFMQQGDVLLIDYGYPRQEYYHPDRHMGTLMCHYKHRAHIDPLILTGLQDITAHVDYTEVMDSAQAMGFTVQHYSNQAQFLINNGIAQFAEQRVDYNDMTKTVAMSQQLQTLTMPHQMGELFKAVVLRK